MSTLKVDKKALMKANIGGRGGKEKALLPIFKDLTRVNESLYDCVDSQGQKYEFKKQQDLQWFDIRKYSNLTKEQKSINMVFIMHEKGEIVGIYTMKLGDMLDFLCNNKKYAKSGWTPTVFKIAAIIKRIAPALQFKAPLKMKEFIGAVGLKSLI